jgi:hypothetical protein
MHDQQNVEQRSESLKGFNLRNINMSINLTRCASAENNDGRFEGATGKLPSASSVYNHVVSTLPPILKVLAYFPCWTFGLIVPAKSHKKTGSASIGLNFRAK